MRLSPESPPSGVELGVYQGSSQSDYLTAFSVVFVAVHLLGFGPVGSEFALGDQFGTAERKRH